MEWTQEQLAARLLISRNYLSLVESGKKQGSVKLLTALHRLRLEVEKDESLAEAQAPSGKPAPNGRIVPATEGLRTIPVLSWAHAGEAVAYEQIAEHEREKVFTASTDPKAFAVIVEGESMLPDYKAGDRVIVAPSRTPRNGRPVVIKLADDGVLIRLFHRINPRTIRLTSLNPEIYPPTDLLEGQYHWCWPVEELIRKLF